MATRQYIGARYVPRFFENTSGTSDWRANTQYEPLTIVTRNGNSYTSKIPVPASVGAPENNPEYWVSTGIYNAQVQELSNRIDTNADNISELQTDVNGLISNKRFFIFIGDSYGNGYTINDGIQSTNWIKETAAHLGLTEGVTYVKNAINGSGFARTNTFLACLQGVTLPDGISAGDVTDIVVCGGYNDRTPDGSATISNGIYQFARYAKNTYPNAKLWGGNIGWCCSADNRALIRDLVIPGYMAQMSANGFRVITDAWKALHNYEYFSSDGLHPLASGHVQLGRAIASQIQGGSYRPAGPIINVSNDLTYESGVSSAGVAQFPPRFVTQMLSDNILVYIGGVFDVTMTEQSSNVEIPLFSVVDTNVSGVAYGAKHAMINILLVDDGNITYPGFADLIFENDPVNPHITHVKVHPYVTRKGSTEQGAWWSGTISRVSLVQQQVFLPYEFI